MLAIIIIFLKLKLLTLLFKILQCQIPWHRVYDFQLGSSLPALLQTCLLLLLHMFSVYYISGSQSIVLGLEVAVMSPENLFKMQILGPCSWHTESQTRGGV